MTPDPITAAESLPELTIEEAEVLLRQQTPWSMYVVLTPAVQAWCLQHNGFNRPISRAKVEALKREMKSGEFQLHHQGISFARDGHLNDGQQRLTAGVEAGVSIPTMISFGMPPENRRIVDTMKPRSTADTFVIGRPYPSAEGQALAQIGTRIVLGLKAPNFQALGLTRDQALEAIGRHERAANFVWKQVFSGRRHPGIPAAVMAVVARAFYKHDLSRLTRFGELLVTWKPEGPVEESLLAFRDWLISKGRKRQKRVYGTTTKVLWHYMRGEPIEKLTPAKKDLFLLPEEETPESAPE